MKLTASAPGKMILLGEYAVLFGAPAVVMAVDRRARVTLEQADVAGIEIHAPDVCPAAVAVRLEPGGALTWLGDDAQADRFELVTGILRGLTIAGIVEPKALDGVRLTLDTQAFFWSAPGQQTTKLGIGSSAALTVTLAGVPAHWCGREAALTDRRHWFAQLLGLHREFQGGSGSGIDLATSLYGGSLRFQAGAGRGVDADVRVIQWPAELERLAVWSGQSASTANFLKRLYAWQANAPEIAGRRLEELSQLAARGADAAESGNAAELLHQLRAYGQSLHELGEAAKIDIFTPEHVQIGGLASRFGVAYKPSGAGGGDLGLAVTGEALALAEFRKALSSTSFAALDLKPDGSGFCIDSRA